jgi:nuclear pore complex protein Nup88
LRTLAEREKAIPHPLTKAEKVLKSQMEAYEADLPLLRQRIDELNERAAVANERADDDIGYVGSRRVTTTTQSDESTEDERAVRRTLAEQTEAIKQNAAKLKLVEEIIANANTPASTCTPTAASSMTSPS